jgi:uncharacterized repeat protein (TIGR03803 family)
MQRRAIFISLIFCLSSAFAPNVRAHAKEKVLYQFTGGADGGYPSSSLVMDTSGNLYGTTGYGGSIGGSCGNSGCGVVFELTPSGNGSWQESVLYAFQGAPDGDFPTGNLVFDASGNLYGTTSRGGTSANCNNEGGCGTVFELSPNSDGWTETVLYDFQNTPDGAGPAGLTFDAHGSLYGTAGGGSNSRGVVYKLSPPKHQVGGKWTERVLYSFSGFGVIPNPGVVFDGQGNLYGTYYDIDVQFCTLGCGAVWQLKHAQGQWTETDLYDFLGGGNGGQPAAGVIRDNQGNLYGTGADGGNNFGMVFELRHRDGQWNEHMLHNFCSRNDCADGAFPLAGLVMDANGALYGTTYWGGTGCLYCGVVFKMSRINHTWKETVLYNFQGGDGSGPQQGLIVDGQGNIYGTAGNAFGDGAGIVFEVMQ